MKDVGWVVLWKCDDSCVAVHCSLLGTLLLTGHYMYRTVVTICTVQGSLYVPHSGQYMYRTVVTICTAQWSLYMYRTVVTICTTSLTFTDSALCPHSVFMCFVWISEQTAIISLYNINWLVFITETECVYCAVRTESLHTASLTFSNSTFCPHSVFVCFVWIWEQTAIISLYSINRLVFITQILCLLCGTSAAAASIWPWPLQ